MAARWCRLGLASTRSWDWVLLVLNTTPLGMDTSFLPGSLKRAPEMLLDEELSRLFVGVPAFEQMVGLEGVLEDRPAPAMMQYWDGVCRGASSPVVRPS